MSKRRVLFAWGRPTPPLLFGGAQVSARLLAERLSRRGFRPTFLGAYGRRTSPARELRQILRRHLEHLRSLGIAPYVDRNDTVRYMYRNVCYELATARRLIERVRRQLHEFHPSCIFTMLEESGEIVRLARTCGVRSVAWIHDALPIGFEPLYERPDHVIFTSEFVRQRCRATLGVEGVVLYPPFRAPAQVARPSAARKQYVTMVNPIALKGVGLFLGIAREMSDRPFLAVEGWGGAPRAWGRRVPDNVRYVRSRHAMGAIWAATRVLLVPSQVEEGFGRVPVEAGLHTTPSIVTARGGLREAVGNTGTLVTEDSVREWTRAIRELDYLTQAEAASVRSIKVATRFLTDPVKVLLAAGILGSPSEVMPPVDATNGQRCHSSSRSAQANSHAGEDGRA